MYQIIIEKKGFITGFTKLLCKFSPSASATTCPIGPQSVLPKKAPATHMTCGINFILPSTLSREGRKGFLPTDASPRFSRHLGLPLSAKMFGAESKDSLSRHNSIIVCSKSLLPCGCRHRTLAAVARLSFFFVDGQFSSRKTQRAILKDAKASGRSSYG